MSLFKNLNYDTRKSFAPVSLLTAGPLVIVTRPDLPASNVRELIALAKSTPGKLTFASSGNGQSTHLAAELFDAMAGVRMVHVPYRGSAPALTDVMGGQADLMFDTMLSSMPYVNGGKLKALAVTGAARSPAAPNVPTVAEAGLPGYEATAWNGLLAPAGTPEPVLLRLSTALQKVLGRADIQQKFAAQGFASEWKTPADTARFLDTEVEKWAGVVRLPAPRSTDPAPAFILPWGVSWLLYPPATPASRACSIRPRSRSSAPPTIPTRSGPTHPLHAAPRLCGHAVPDQPATRRSPGRTRLAQPGRVARGAGPGDRGGGRRAGGAGGG